MLWTKDKNMTQHEPQQHDNLGHDMEEKPQLKKSS